MAIDVLSIPAMSDEPERVFSGARRTISWDRARLGASTIERTQCLKSWMASGVVSGEVEVVEEVEGPGEAEGQGSDSDRDVIDNID
jgi:hAT family protein